MPAKYLTLVLAAVVTVAAVWYVVAPPRSQSAYRERAAQTAESLRSHVQTARLWADAERRGRATREAATIGFDEAETDAQATASTFSAYDPPPGTKDLRTRVTRAATDVKDALATLRIAAHRDAWSRVPAAARPLEELATRLDGLAREARR
jgi:hypothetical protein